MILLVHLFVGAVIAAKVGLFALAVFLAFLSHYFLDSLPHAEYPIDNIKKRRWKNSRPDIIKLTLDGTIGLLLVLVVCCFTGASCLFVFIAAFFSILPDILVASKWMFPGNNLLEKHFIIHHKIHFPENKKTPAWKGISVELLVILLGFLLI